jgi:CubicO group peptidase (beta-lactamase class C family)
VRQLLSHQGGLACEWPGSLEEFGDDDEALLRVAAGEPRLLPFGPGELFSYSNVGFWLVGAAIAQSCGATFEEAMHTQVLDPLALGSTGFEAESPVPGYVQVAPGADEHRRFDGGYPRVRRPSGGLLSSVGDLLRFAESQFERRDLQRPLVSGPGFEHGLGWFLRKRAGRRSVEHPGSAAGYQSLLLLIPEERVAFVALTNSSRGLAAITDLLDRLGLATDTPEEAPLTSEQLGKFVGRYEAPGVRLELSPDANGLRLDYSEKDPFRREWDAYPPIRLRAVGEREFELVDGEWRGQWLGFPRDGVVSFGIVAQRVG